MVSGVLACLVVGALAGANAFAVAADETTIRTSTGTFKLSPSDPSRLVDETALRSARRTTELAMAAVAADVDQLKAKQDALDKEFKAFNKQLDAVKADLNSQKKALDVELDAFEARMDAFIGEMKGYNAEVDDQRAQVDASNSLRADQRNAATVNRLNAWGDRLDAKKASLESKRNALDREGEAYDRKAEKYDKYRENKIAEMTAAHDKLIKRQEDLTPKLGEAYRQLQICYRYAKEIDKLLSDKYGVNVSTSTGVMADVGERLKELSNAGFDGNADKPALTEQNKGANTEFFKK
jgi:chromosome segregation ATPase